MAFIDSFITVADKAGADVKIYGKLDDVANVFYPGYVLDSTSLAALETINAVQSGTWTIGTITPGTAATSLGKAEDAAHTTGDTGVFMLGVRQDADTSPVSATGDYHAPIFDNAGNLKVNVKLGSAAGTEFAEDTAHTTGALGTMVLAVRNDADTALAGTTGDYIPLTTDADGALRVGQAHLDAATDFPAAVGVTIVPAASFTRPADTTAYTLGDLVANSTTAGSVAPMSFTVTRTNGLSGLIRRCRIRTSSTSVTNALFRLHLYGVSPTATNGDNGVWLTNQAANYIGALDITVDRAFSDGAAGNGLPLMGSELNFVGSTIYGLLEARAAYTPTSGGGFTIALEVMSN